MISKRDETLGAMLTRLIKSRGVLKKDVAADARIDPTTLRNVLGDRYDPLLHNLGAILNALKVSSREREAVLRVADYPKRDTLGGLLVRLIIKREVQLMVLATDAGVGERTLRRMLKNQPHPHLHNLDRILTTLDVSNEKREEILRVAGYLEPKNNRFGNLHASFRKKRNIPRDKHANDIGILPNSLGCWERGKVRHPRRAILE